MNLLIDAVRQITVIKAADDPGTTMDLAFSAFEEMGNLAAHGDHERVRRAAVVVGALCLALCVNPAASMTAADEKCRFLAIMIQWAWPREPALGAVLEAAQRAEAQAWSGILIQGETASRS